MDAPVSLVVDEKLAIVSLDSPPLNLFDGPVFAGFEEMAERLAADPPRAVLIRAAGKVVSAGVDVSVFSGLEPESAAALWRRQVQMVNTIESLPCPTVFAAHALCLTAAFEISLACDLLLASEAASFGLVESRIGLTPSMGGTQRLAERAGPARAHELVMTGDVYPAATLERWNVVNRVLPPDNFADAALEFAQSLAKGPSRAHAVTKRVVKEQVGSGLHAADEAMIAGSATLFETDDLKGGVASFLADGPGKATFEGR